MVKRVVLIGLLLSAGYLWSQKNGVDNYVVPTKIAAVPVAFTRGQVVGMHASFQQKTFVCPTIKDPTMGYGIRIYAEKAVFTEPIWEDKNETPYIASTNATVNPNPQDDGKKVERDFEQFKVPDTAPQRIYAVVWRSCGWKTLEKVADPPIYSEHSKADGYGGRWFRYACRATGKTPSKECKYRAE